MKLKFAKLNPSGNTTAVIDNRDGKLPREGYAALAADLMGKNRLAVEQVGYWEQPTREGSVGRLQMMGGEFCGNATRCFAKLLCDHKTEGIVWKGTDCVVPLEISGSPYVMMVKVEDYRQESAMITSSMPQALKLEPVTCAGISQPAIGVFFEGILHLILQNVMLSEEQIRESIYKIYKDRAKRHQDLPDAIGFMFYDEEKHFVTPAVYVKEVESLVFESSCGSGSVGIAAYIFHTLGEEVEKMLIKQPGGDLYVTYKQSGDDLMVELGGLIRTECVGDVWI